MNKKNRLYKERSLLLRKKRLETISSSESLRLKEIEAEISSLQLADVAEVQKRYDDWWDRLQKLENKLREIEKELLKLEDDK